MFTARLRFSFAPRTLLGALLAAVLLLGSTTSSAAVWKTTRTWDEDAERAFSGFIRKLPLDYFVRNDHPFGRISTDCADAAYTLRIIFASTYGLPVRFSTGQGVKTNLLTNFDDIADPQKRVRKFIEYINDNTNTETLSSDSYPVAIRPGVLRPGIMFLHTQGDASVPLTYRSGHVYYLKEVRDNGIIRYVSSTVPASIRNLNTRLGLNFAPMSPSAGYRAWKWPDSDTRPNQSLEQFTLADWHPASYGDARLWYAWQGAVTSQIALVPATPKEKLQAQLENLQNVIEERVTAVNEGWAFYQSKYGGQGCMSEEDYHNYSTPTRDMKTQVELQNFELYSKQYVRANNLPYDDDDYMTAFYQQFQFTVGGGRVMSVKDLNTTFLSKVSLQVSEPEHSPTVRWGPRLIDRSEWTCPERAKNYVGHDQM